MQIDRAHLTCEGKVCDLKDVSKFPGACAKFHVGGAAGGGDCIDGPGRG